jgi:Domain of unknown function (DUF5076)
MSEPRQLMIPPEAHTASEAIEVLRAWIADQRLHCSLLPTAFDEPDAWGILLADVAHHIADGLAEATGRDAAETLETIRAMFNAELSEPTDEPQGGFLPEN